MAKKHRSSPDFAAIGETFNDATTQLVGGISTDNQARVLADLTSVQRSLSKLLTRQPDTFSEESTIHVQNVVDQLNLEIDAVKSFGTDPFAAKYINDVQRDLIDIINGDDALAALANRHGANGFAVVPDLLSDPAPFLGSPEQTAFMTKFVADANDLGAEAVALISSGVGASDQRTLALEQKIQDFASNADAFTKEQGGLYSARFDNEFAYYGVNGTASRALVDGLADGDAAKVQAAASVLAGNAVDVATNMLGFGNPPTPPNSGIPDDIDSFAVAGTVFNDATTRLIGGVYDGNRNDIVADLLATQEGIQTVMEDSQFKGRALADARKIVDLLGREVTAVEAAGTDLAANEKVNDLHRAILGIVQRNDTLAEAASAGDLQGFMPLPKSGNGAGDRIARKSDDDHRGAAGGGGDAGDHPHMPHDDHSHLWG